MDTFFEKLALKEDKIVLSLEDQTEILMNVQKIMGESGKEMVMEQGMDQMSTVLDDDLSGCRSITE